VTSFTVASSVTPEELYASRASAQRVSLGDAVQQIEPGPLAGADRDRGARAFAAEAVLELQGICLAFKGIRALSEVSLRVPPGEICGLIGPNGAGKSSLLNVVSGVYRPSAGSIHFGGRAQALIDPGWAARQGMARTFQNIALFKGMSVLDNLLAARSLFTRSTFLEQALGLPRARREAKFERQRAEQIAARVGVAEQRDAVVGRLPYGVQKRVELGRALAAEPRLLLLDEPFAGMSAEEKRSMAELIVDINAELGTTILLIEHDTSIVLDLSDHVVVLEYGRKIADGTPDQVREDRAVIDAYLGIEVATHAAA
jgi:branched-chain amino acid transport system ATP-binding protein